MFSDSYICLWIFYEHYVYLNVFASWSYLTQLQAQEREFCDTLHFLCIYRLSPTCIFRETSTKANRDANSWRLSSLPYFHPLDCYIKPTALLCPLLSTAFHRLASSTDFLSSLGPFSPRPLPVWREISSSSPLFGFRAKTDIEIVWQLTHTPNTMAS